jgi:hypothetical protein
MIPKSSKFTKFKKSINKIYYQRIIEYNVLEVEFSLKSISNDSLCFNKLRTSNQGIKLKLEFYNLSIYINCRFD